MFIYNQMNKKEINENDLIILPQDHHSSNPWVSIPDHPFTLFAHSLFHFRFLCTYKHAV